MSRGVHRVADVQAAFAEFNAACTVTYNAGETLVSCVLDLVGNDQSPESAALVNRLRAVIEEIAVVNGSLAKLVELSR